MRDGWRPTTLGEVATLEYGKGLTERDRDGHGWPVYGSAGVVGHHSTPLVDRAPVIIVGRKGTAGSIHWSDTPCWPIDTTYFVKPLARCEPRYLFLALESAGLQDLCAQTGVPGLNRERAYQAELLLPPLDEQRRIVDLIAAVDEAIDAANKVVETARRARKALLSDLLSDERARREGWEVIGLGDCEAAGRIKLSRGHVISRSDIESSPGNYPVYSSSITNNGEFGRYGLYAFDEELITWSVDGGGNFFYRPRHKFSVTNVGGILKVLDPNINCAFLAFELQYLHSKLRFDYQFKAHPSVIRIAYTLMLPPLRVQQQIADLIKAVDDEIVVAEAVASRTRALRSALLSDLLSGQHEIPASYDEVLDLAA